MRRLITFAAIIWPAALGGPALADVLIGIAGSRRDHMPGSASR